MCEHGMYWPGSRWGELAGPFQRRNVLSGSIKCGEFLI